MGTTVPKIRERWNRMIGRSDADVLPSAVIGECAIGHRCDKPASSVVARPFAVLVAVALIQPLTLSAPARADSSPTLSCPSPPPGVVLPAEEKDRFVRLWKPRVTNTAYFQGYVDLEAVPPAVRNEGFHRLDGATRSWLVACLVDDLIRTVGFEGQPAGVSPPAPRVLENIAYLGLLIFEKAQVNAMRRDAALPPPVTETGPPQSQLALGEETRVLASTNVPSLPARGAVPALPGPEAAAVKAEVSASLRVSPPTQLVGLVGALVKQALNAPANLLARPPLNLISGATYRVCREGNDVSIACTVPIPIGVPVPIGLDGDLLPDVSAQLLLRPDLAHLQDGIVSFTVARLATAPRGPLPYRVFAVYDPPLTSKRIEFGFDGRPSTLADKTTAKITVRRLFAPSGTDLDAELAITHDKPGSVEAITFAIKRLENQGPLRGLVEVDPFVGAVQLTPVPRSLTVRVQIKAVDGGEDASVVLSSSAPSLAEAQLVRELAEGTITSRRELGARVDQLPSSATIDLSRRETVNALHYAASSAIAHLSVTDRRIPDRAAPGSFGESLYAAQKVPADVAITVTGGEEVHYRASADVEKASVARATYSGSPSPTSLLAAEARSVPKSVDLLLRPAESTIEWTASDVTGGLDASARFGPAVARSGRTEDAAVSLTGIPRQWVASLAAEHPRFEGLSGPIGRLRGTFTNHGTATTLPGDHLSAVFDDSSGEIDLSVQATALSLADFEPLESSGSGFRAALRMGEGSSFLLHAKATRGDVVGVLLGQLAPLPSAVRIEDVSGRLTYEASANSTVTIAADYGTRRALEAAAEPPERHGLAVRDGKACDGDACGTATKSRMFLTGFPKVLDFDPATGVYLVKDFAPDGPLVLDIALAHITPKPVTALVSQEGIPAGIDFTFGPSGTTRLADGTVTTHLGYTASSSMGKLTAAVGMGDDESYFETSTVPSSIAVDTTFAPGSKTVKATLGSPIAHVAVLSRRAGESTFSAGLGLGDVPTSLELVVGQQDAEPDLAMPKFSYHASSAGLDIVLFAPARLFGGGARTATQLSVTNFGKDFAAGRDGKQWKILSTPATEAFNLLGSGHLSVHDRPSGGGFLSIDHQLDLEVEFSELNVVFHNLTSLILTPKVPTIGIQGQYGDFGLAAKSYGEVDFSLGAYVNLGIGKIELIRFFRTIQKGEFVGNFRLATNHKGFWKRISTGLICFEGWKQKRLYVRLDTLPHPHDTTGGGAFLVSPPGGGEGDAWLATLNPFGLLSDTALDIAAFVRTPFGNNLDSQTTCGRD